MVKKKLTILRNVFVNKKTGQASITLPKKQMINFFGFKNVPNKLRIYIEDK